MTGLTSVRRSTSLGSSTSVSSSASRAFVPIISLSRHAQSKPTTVTSKAEFDKRDYCVLLELRMIKNKMKLLSSPNYDFSSAEDDQPVEQRPAQIARREASTDVSDESRAALFEDARTTSMWNVVSPLIMPFLGHFEWGTDN